MKKKTMLYLFLLFSPLFLYGVYVVSVLAYGSATQYQPEQKIELSENNSKTLNLQDSTIRFLSWNIGYSGLGHKADFFLDGGTMVRSKKKDINKYLKGIKEFIESEKNNDFILLQEVDLNSKRSYFINQFEQLESVLDAHSSVFASNFKVNYIPVPLSSTQPLGRVHSGLASFSKFASTENLRLQFPGEYEWPKRIFHLDRCILLKRVPVPNGKELIVVNSHNSAYDGGKLKPLEMEFLKNYLLEEYNKGNYIVVGADWNQCPPNFAYDSFAKNNTDNYAQTNIDENFLPLDWQWVFDPKTATNRKLSKAYEKEKTFTTLIDFYLVSPNIEVLDVQTVDLDFQFSDHQPIKMEIKLKE